MAVKASEKEVLKLDHVRKTYHVGERDLHALDDVSFTIHKGDFITLLGPSGSGKSTLLHMMGLLDSPSSGKVYIDGIDVSSMDDSKKARIRGKKIGFIFQSFNLIPSITAFENVVLPMLICEDFSQSKQKAAIDLLERVGLKNRMHHYPGQLSGGERQRVAIARALVNDPELILADEPTGNLDTKTGSEILKIFKELNALGKTVVIITHDVGITKLTRETIRIIDGKVNGG
ncbi:MAG: ABC transporter ATP-binding protein [Candidatus Micrarchaeota archaeon]